MVFKGGGIGSRSGCALDLQHPLGPSSFAVFAVPPRIKPPHDFHRAIRRCGQLLNDIEKATNRHDVTRAGTGRARAARAAGLSHRQKHTAVRVARVPERDFDAAVDADAPATVTELAGGGN